MKKYESTLIMSDVKVGDIACSAGVPTKIGEYEVPRGEILELGVGDMRGQDGTRGRFFFDVKTSANAETNGTVRIEVRTPQDRHLVTVYENRTEKLRSGATSIIERVPFPASIFDAMIGEDKKIQIYFIADSAVTFGEDESTLLMDVSRVDV